MAEALASSLRLSQLEFDRLRESAWVAADNRAAVHKHGGRAIHVQAQTILLVGFHFLGGLGRGHTGLERVDVESGLPRILSELVPHIFGVDRVLIFIDRVVDFPERIGRLFEGTACANGGGLGPRMDLLEGKILKHQANFVLLEQILQDRLELAASRALEITELDKRYARIAGAFDGIALDV